MNFDLAIYIVAAILIVGGGIASLITGSPIWFIVGLAICVIVGLWLDS